MNTLNNYIDISMNNQLDISMNNSVNNSTQSVNNMNIINNFANSINNLWNNSGTTLFFDETPVIYESDSCINNMISFINYDSFNILYSDELSQTEMEKDLSTYVLSTFSVKLNNLDVNSLRLDSINLITNDENIKFGNICIKLGGNYINYPIFEFNIDKTNNGYKIDLTKLKEFGFGDIITKLLIYHHIHLILEYSGNINYAYLHYYKTQSNNIQNSYLQNVIDINSVVNMKITNFNVTNINNDNSYNTMYNTKLNFYNTANKVEIRCNDIKEDLEKIELYFDSQIYNKYTIEKEQNKIILNFDKYINFNKIESVSISIKFKIPKERNIIIYNQYYNCLQIKDGMGLVRLGNEGYGYCKKLSIDDIIQNIKSNNNFNIFNNINNFNKLDLNYM
jgi:hypothetical protein